MQYFGPQALDTRPRPLWAAVRTFKRGFLSNDTILQVAEFDSSHVVRSDGERTARYVNSAVRELHLVVTCQSSQQLVHTVSMFSAPRRRFGTAIPKGPPLWKLSFMVVAGNSSWYLPQPDDWP